MKSGTSMATPHVAGLVAYLIDLRGNCSASDMIQLVKDLALQDTLTNLRESHRMWWDSAYGCSPADKTDTPNLLAHLPLS